LDNLQKYLLENGRGFTKEESEAYEESLDELFEETCKRYDEVLTKLGDDNEMGIEDSIQNKDDAFKLIMAIGLDYDGFRKSESLMDLIDELCEIASIGYGLDKKEEEDKKTIEEWEEIKQIKILDPDGFDRTDDKLYDRKFTEEEFDKGLMFSTVSLDNEGYHPGKYRKQPVEIDAVRWLGVNYPEVDDFIEYKHETFPSSGLITIDTLEGQMKARVGDYIIKGVEDEYYPCKPNIFDKTYEKVEDDN
jgi:hypothetical protein